MSHKGPIRGVILGEAHLVPLREGLEREALLASAGPQSLVEMAQEEAAAILADAETARERSIAEGWNEGYAAGVADGAGRLAQVVSAVEGALVQLDGELQDLPERIARDVAALAVETASRLIRAELAVRPERVLEVVRGAIRKATDRETLIVRVSPVDLEVLRQESPELMQQMGGIRRLDVIEDPRIPSGGCVLETPTGDIDATMKSQMRRVLEALAAPPDHELVAAATEG